MEKTAKYQIQKGIVLETICGQDLLIATSEAREKCPYLMQINKESAFIWKHLMNEKTTSEITDEIVQSYDISKKEAEKALTEFLEACEKNNLIIPEKI